MNSYDTAHQLAKEIRESEVYQSYCVAKDKAFEKDLNRDLYKQYVQLAREIQATQFANQSVSAETQEKYGRLVGLLSLNTELTQFMMAEHRLNQLISDVFKIIGDAVDLNLDFLND